MYNGMAQDFAKSFYKSKEWQQTRSLYISFVGGLCERCWQKGRLTPGEIVHHKTHLNPENISDPNISLSFDNLELLCRDCHAEEHSSRGERRYTISDDGTVTAR